jgi:hypothetical protein
VVRSDLGNYLIAGAPYDDAYSPTVIDAGAAYVFSLGGTPLSWTEQQTLQPSSPIANNYFGYSVAISENYLVVGAYGHDSNAGAVYVFSGTNWIDQVKLQPIAPAAQDEFGKSVAISENYLVVGASGHDSDAGAVYVFSGTNWIDQVKLQPITPITNDLFGYSVSISEDSLVVGAYGHDSNAGAVYVFSGTNWIDQVKLQPIAPAAQDEFGKSVAISENYLVVGASGHDSDAGAVYVFSGTNWIDQVKLQPITPITNDLFGYSVSISEDSLVAGAYGHGVGGAAYVFSLSGTSWNEQQKLQPITPIADDRFGYSVVISEDNYLVAGATRHQGGGWNAGAAYVFSIPTSVPSNAPSNTPSNAPSNAPTNFPTVTLSQVVTCSFPGGASDYKGDTKTAYEDGYFTAIGIKVWDGQSYSFQPGCSGTSSAVDIARRSSLDITFDSRASGDFDFVASAAMASLDATQLGLAITTAGSNLGFELGDVNILAIPSTDDNVTTNTNNVTTDTNSESDEG